MGKKKEPKFKVGDTIIIKMYGTVGKITDVIFLFLLVICYHFNMTHWGDTKWHWLRFIYVYQETKNN
ncbi:hypothetical protein D1953_00220 [Peribacillus asahii]|uniref:Uncharacterized protein n=1 Tax=Peribacillus asahii TaxID=228899 RepID=A0A398BKK2_9BACI|nr:hypothetical protein [Peribacillus asahii]RID89038.1 hypothetical protein D1953_00220 [Peribacillus asahii]